MVVVRERQKASPSRMSCENVEGLLMKEEEQGISRELGSPRADGKDRQESWLACVRIVREAKERAKTLLASAKIARQTKTDLEKYWDVVSEAVEKLAREVLHHPVVPEELMEEVVVTLTQRGIETGAEWRDYVDTVEKDGELVNELCDFLQTDVSQLKRTVESRCQKRLSKDSPETRFGEAVEQRPSQLTVEGSWQRSGVQERSTSVHNCRAHGAGPWPTAPLREDAGVLSSVHLVNYLRSIACADPGVFKGTRGENFGEFLRKFRRRYETVISCDEALVEILADGHLAGRAKNVFASLPRSVRECGFEAVTQEMARLMAYDSTAGRMRALTELKNLRMRPGQEVSEFCVVLERVGRQANPECTLEDRSMEYAQILLDNLSDWPEHFQLVGALHKVEPRKAYEEVKQLALCIEQSRIMLGANERRSMAWKSRCAQYQCSREQRSAVVVGETDPDIERQRAGEKTRYNAETSVAREARAMNFSDHRHQRQEEGHPEAMQSKKCYRCEGFGHIARECPEKALRVNHTFQKEPPSEDETKLSPIIERSRSMEMKARRKRSDQSDLIGKRFTVPVRLLGDRCTALVDTGSMISIIPLKVLAKAQDRGWDVDSLKVVPKSKLKPVFDASNNRMNFVGAVRIEVEMDSGNPKMIAFHISADKEAETILGTNALEKLGIDVAVNKECRKDLVSLDKRNRNKVVVSSSYCPSKMNAKSHESVTAQNNGLGSHRKGMYVRKNKVDGKRYPKVGNRLYVPTSKEGDPKLAVHWRGLSKVSEAKNSRPSSSVGQDSKAIFGRPKMLRPASEGFLDREVYTEHNGGDESRKPKMRASQVPTHRQEGRQQDYCDTRKANGFEILASSDRRGRRLHEGEAC